MAKKKWKGTIHDKAPKDRTPKDYSCWVGIKNTDTGICITVHGRKTNAGKHILTEKATPEEIGKTFLALAAKANGKTVPKETGSSAKEGV